MPQIVQGNTLNLTALVVPDLYVVILPPSQLTLNGVPTNVIGVVGTASWGPNNVPTVVGNMAQYSQAFGPIQNRLSDMGTQVATAVQQGASNFRCVRVSNGTDVAASFQIAPGAGGIYAVLLTGRYTGTTGNSISATLMFGAMTGTFQLVISMPGQLPEVFVFSNSTITARPAIWAALVAAVNNGTGTLRGPSQLVVASIGTNTTAAPGTGYTGTLAGGTDGAGAGIAGLSAAMLVGQNATYPFTGMYALSNSGVSVGVLADVTDTTTFTTQLAFGLVQGIYMIVTTPAGDTIPNAIAAKNAAGITSYAVKYMFGDWLYWQDPVNSVLRLVSPQGFVAGRLGNLSPEQSSLNKPIYGVVGSQSFGVVGSTQANSYDTAQLQDLFSNGIDVITNPQPGGPYWGVRNGHNSSLDPTVYGDNYTRLTNYIAATLAAGMGGYIGQTINKGLLQNIRATMLSFFSNLLQVNVLARQLDGSLPYAVVCDATNNPLSLTSLGFVTASAQVQYQGINEKFIVNLQGGTTVQISSQLLPTS